MAQNVVIRSVTYQNVPSVEIPKSGGGGNAVFIDTSDATLNNASKLPNGVTAYANGTKYTGNAAENDSSDLTVSGATVTVPAGYYSSSASGTVASGSATAAATISGTAATVSTGTNTLTLSKTVSNTPQVTAGYIASGTAGNSSVSLTANVTTKGTATITPTTSNQTIASGTYLTGTQTISGDANLVAGNIKSGTTIFGVTGTYSGGGGSGLEYEEGTWTPSEETGYPTILFAKNHDTLPTMVSLTDIGEGFTPTGTTAVTVWQYYDAWKMAGHGFPSSSNTLAYSYIDIFYVSKSGGIGSTRVTTSHNSSETGSDAQYPSYYVSTTAFMPYTNGSRYYKAGRTYKWIAVWYPTT